MAGVFFLAFLAFLAVVPPPFSKGRFATVGFAHTSLHALAFCLAFLLLAAGSATARKSAGWAVILLLFGATLEVLQAHRYGIWLEYRDIFSDAGGIILGYITRLICTATNAPSVGLKSHRP